MSDNVTLGLNNSNTASVRGVAVGINNYAQADTSLAVGISAAAQNSNAVAVGVNVATSANNSMSIGTQMQGTTEGELGWNNGTFSDGQSYQGRISWSKLWVQTTDDTPTQLGLSDGTDPRTNTPTGGLRTANPHSTILYDIDVIARENDIVGSPSIPSINSYWTLKFVVAVDGNRPTHTAHIVGSVTKTVVAQDMAASSWNVDIDISDPEYVRLYVTGEDGVTIRWLARVNVSRVGFNYISE